VDNGPTGTPRGTGGEVLRRSYVRRRGVSSVEPRGDGGSARCVPMLAGCVIELVEGESRALTHTGAVRQQGPASQVRS